MNIRRFVGKNAREAIAQARALWGDQAVVLSNRPVPGGVEILAMPGAEVPVHGDIAAMQEPVASARAVAPASAKPAAAKPAASAANGAHVEPMSTVSFQQFVRERQRKDVAAVATPVAAHAAPVAAPQAAARRPMPIVTLPAAPVGFHVEEESFARTPPVEPGRFAAQALREHEQSAREQAAAAVRAESVVMPNPNPKPAAPVTLAAPTATEAELMAELKSMRGMIAAQLAGMSWFDNVRRNPGQTQLLRLMMSNGYSPSLARQVVDRLPDDVPEHQASHWLLDVLSRNLRCAGADSILEHGGVYAMVGPTGVGKTTTTAKMAAHFAAKHGAASVGLITVDTYRMGATDQLRAFGKLLNIPVHTARDTTALVDLLDLFAGKKLVLIDTVGLGQRDRRLASLFAAIPSSRVKRLLVLNASAQGETLEEVVQAYGAGPGSHCVISKLDEAVKCGAVMDVALRHQLIVEGFANGQRVPEDWHAPRAQLLVQKSLMKQPTSVFMPDDADLGLMLTTPAQGGTHAGSQVHHA